MIISNLTTFLNVFDHYSDKYSRGTVTNFRGGSIMLCPMCQNEMIKGVHAKVKYSNYVLKCPECEFSILYNGRVNIDSSVEII